jgi:hypothetical protein
MACMHYCNMYIYLSNYLFIYSFIFMFIIILLCIYYIYVWLHWINLNYICLIDGCINHTPYSNRFKQCQVVARSSQKLTTNSWSRWSDSFGLLISDSSAEFLAPIRSQLVRYGQGVSSADREAWGTCCLRFMIAGCHEKGVNTRRCATKSKVYAGFQQSRPAVWDTEEDDLERAGRIYL